MFKLNYMSDLKILIPVIVSLWLKVYYKNNNNRRIYIRNGVFIRKLYNKFWKYTRL